MNFIPNSCGGRQNINARAHCEYNINICVIFPCRILYVLKEHYTIIHNDQLLYIIQEFFLLITSFLLSVPTKSAKKIEIRSEKKIRIGFI